MSTSNLRKIDQSNYQQAEDRVLELHGSLRRVIRAARAATVMGQVMLVLLLFILLVGVFAISSTPADLAELRATPVLGSAILLARRLLMALPAPWYLRLLGAVLAAILAGSLFYQAARLIFSALFGIIPCKLSLPKNPVARVKKLHNEVESLLRSAGRLDDNAHLLAPVLAMALTVLMGIWSAATSDDAIAILLGSVIAAGIVGGAVTMLSLLLLWLNGLFSNVLTEGEREELREIQSGLREYWLSIDPQEAAKVAREAARERQQRASSSTYSGGYSGLGMYSGFDVHDYVVKNCSRYRLGLVTEEELNMIGSDPNLTSEQRTAVETELRRMAAMYY